MTEFYAMYYTGSTGSGHAVFAMKDGMIVGADPLGGILDGTYEATEGGAIHVSVKLTLPAGTRLVTGVDIGQDNRTQDISTELPADWGAGKTIAVQTPTGPVNVIFRHLRSMP